MLVCAHKVQRCGKKPSGPVYEFILTCLIYRTNKTFQKTFFFKESAHLFAKSDLNLHTVLHPSKQFFWKQISVFQQNVPNYPHIKIIFTH